MDDHDAQRFPIELPTDGGPPTVFLPQPSRHEVPPAQAPLQLYPGGYASFPQQREQRREELERLLLHLRTHQEAIEQALEPFQETMKDLERDWSTRGKDVWQRQLGALHTLRSAIHAALALFQNDRLPWGLRAQQFQITGPLEHADKQVDTVGIAVTAYLPEASSVTRQHLQQRQAILTDLRELVKRTQAALVLISQPGCEHCRQAHYRAEQDWIRHQRAMAEGNVTAEDWQRSLSEQEEGNHEKEEG